MSDLFKKENLSTELAAEQYSTHRFQFDQESELDFELSLPTTLHQQETTDLIRLVDDGEHGVSVVVSVQSMIRDLHPADLIEGQLELANCEVLDKTYLPSASGIDVDILYDSVDGFVHRLRTIKNGKRVFTVDIAARKESFAQCANLAFRAIASFRLINPVSSNLAEKQIKYSTDSPYHIEFKHFESWDVLPVVEDELLVFSVEGEQGKGTSEGNIHVSLQQVNSTGSSKRSADSIMPPPIFGF